MRIMLDTPQPIEQLRKVYNDRVTFVSSVSHYPLISELEISGEYLSGLRKRLVPVRVGKRVDRLIRRYTRRLERVWRRYQRELLASLRLDHLKKFAPAGETEKADAPTLAQVLAETDPSRQQVLYMRYLRARKAQLITPKLDAMREDLNRTAAPMFRNAYLLGKERGQVLTSQELDEELTDEDEALLEEREDQNDEFLAALVDGVSDEYEKALSEDYPTEEALLAALALAHQKQAYRLPKFAAALGSSLLAAGMAQAIRDVQELDEAGRPTGHPRIDEETGLPVGEVVEGGYWHTSHDNRVCEGCERNDGFWMTVEDFQEEAGTNDCLSNCRCIELFEPAPMPEDANRIWTGSPGMDKGLGMPKHG